MEKHVYIPSENIVVSVQCHAHTSIRNKCPGCLPASGYEDVVSAENIVCLNWYWGECTLCLCRLFGVSHRGSSGASAVQLPHGDAQKSRDSHPGGQEVHGHRERWWTADPLPGCHTETWNDASLQLRSAAGFVRGPPQRHGEAPVLPRLWLLLQSGEYTVTDQFQHSCLTGILCGLTRLWTIHTVHCSTFPVVVEIHAEHKCLFLSLSLGINSVHDEKSNCVKRAWNPSSEPGNKDNKI